MMYRDDIDAKIKDLEREHRLASNADYKAVLGRRIAAYKRIRAKAPEKMVHASLENANTRSWNGSWRSTFAAAYEEVTGRPYGI